MLSKTFNSFHIIQTQNSSATTAFFNSKFARLWSKNVQDFLQKMWYKKLLSKLRAFTTNAKQ